MSIRGDTAAPPMGGARRNAEVKRLAAMRKIDKLLRESGGQMQQKEVCEKIGINGSFFRIVFDTTPHDWEVKRCRLPGKKGERFMVSFKSEIGSRKPDA
jgi:hypothetical protein